MESKPTPPPPVFQILVFGDFVVDEYLVGEQVNDRFVVTGSLKCAGCAGNVVENLLALYQPGIDIKNLCDYGNNLILTRLIDNKTGKKLLEHWNQPLVNLTSYSVLGDIGPIDVGSVVSGKIPVGVIFSDYNKGALQNPIPAKKPFACKWAIVDSRYRSFNLDLLDYSQLNFWHATGKEYDEDSSWGNSFDFIIRTDGPGKVSLIGTKAGNFKLTPTKEVLAEFEVPQETNVVDTTGAGDTFVATLATCFAKYEIHKFPIQRQELRDLIGKAIQEAIASCQTVVSEPLTSVTTYKLKD